MGLGGYPTVSLKAARAAARAAKEKAATGVDPIEEKHGKAKAREAVPHGFRTWVDGTRPHDAAATEKALAHEDENTVAARYQRSDLFDLRVPLMAAWAGWCCSRAGQVEEKSRQHRAAPQRAGSGLLNTKPRSRPEQRSGTPEGLRPLIEAWGEWCCGAAGWKSAEEAERLTETAS